VERFGSRSATTHCASVQAVIWTITTPFGKPRKNVLRSIAASLGTCLKAVLHLASTPEEVPEAETSRTFTASPAVPEESGTRKPTAHLIHPQKAPPTGSGAPDDPFPGPIHPFESTIVKIFPCVIDCDGQYTLADPVCFPARGVGHYAVDADVDVESDRRVLLESDSTRVDIFVESGEEAQSYCCCSSNAYDGLFESGCPWVCFETRVVSYLPCPLPSLHPTIIIIISFMHLFHLLHFLSLFSSYFYSLFSWLYYTPDIKPVHQRFSHACNVEECRMPIASFPKWSATTFIFVRLDFLLLLHCYILGF